MSRQIKLGVVGTGKMAQAFASSLVHAEGVALSAVSSRRQQTADRFAAEFSVPESHDSLAGMLRDSELDLIYVASPHAMHCDDTLACLEAGKAVLCEKPFAINARQAGSMIARAREKKLFLMEAMWTRYIPAVARLRDLLAGDAIGKVNLMLAGGAFMPPYDPDSYLFRPDLGGGVLLDAGVYLVSMASMLFGPPVEIRASGLISEQGVDDHDAFLLRHRCDAIANLHISLRASQAPEVLLLGERGTLRVHAPLFAPTRLTLSRTGKEPEVIELPFDGNGYQFEVIEAARCIRQGRIESATMPLAESLTIMETMDEIRRQIGLTYPMEN